ncbi:hypothetical protein KM043_001048 [Ampulex compressa]|nr:hypothetical protein KM043_001048 [Ampulex compressa]
MGLTPTTGARSWLGNAVQLAQAQDRAPGHPENSLCPHCPGDFCPRAAHGPVLPRKLPISAAQGISMARAASGILPPAFFRLQVGHPLSTLCLSAYLSLSAEERTGALGRNDCPEIRELFQRCRTSSAVATEITGRPRGYDRFYKPPLVPNGRKTGLVFLDRGLLVLCLGNSLICGLREAVLFSHFGDLDSASGSWIEVLGWAG